MNWWLTFIINSVKNITLVWCYWYWHSWLVVLTGERCWHNSDDWRRTPVSLHDDRDTCDADRRRRPSKSQVERVRDRLPHVRRVVKCHVVRQQLRHGQCRTPTSRLLRVCYHLAVITCITPVWVTDNVALRHPVYSGSVIITWAWLPVSRLYESLTMSHSDIPSTPGLLSPGVITCLTPVWVCVWISETAN